MNSFREIQPPNTIQPVRKRKQSVQKKNKKPSKRREKGEQSIDKEVQHKVDEFI